MGGHVPTRHSFTSIMGVALLYDLCTSFLQARIKYHLISMSMNASFSQYGTHKKEANVQS